MKPEFEALPLVKNEQKKRFEMEVNAHYVFINYGESGHRLPWHTPSQNPNWPAPALPPQ